MCNYSLGCRSLLRVHSSPGSGMLTPLAGTLTPMLPPRSRTGRSLHFSRSHSTNSQRSAHFNSPLTTSAFSAKATPLLRSSSSSNMSYKPYDHSMFSCKLDVALRRFGELEHPHQLTGETPTSQRWNKVTDVFYATCIHCMLCMLR